jgi:hypothetical protein
MSIIYNIKIDFSNLHSEATSEIIIVVKIRQPSLKKKKKKDTFAHQMKVRNKLIWPKTDNF